MANTIDWGKATQNNTNGFGKYQNTINAGIIYADSYSGETTLVGTSAAFSYSASSFHQGEADPTPTITGTTGGTFSATPSGLSINTSTGTIDLDNSTIQSYTITYTVSGVSAQQSLAVTASPFVANNFSMQFDGTNYISLGSSIDLGTTSSISFWLRNEVSQDRTLLGEDSYGADYHILGGYNHFLVRIGSSFMVFTTGTVPIIPIVGAWSHLVFTRDGDTVTCYINGSSIGSSSTWTGGSPASTTTKFDTIGAKSNASSFTIGKMDELAAWNTALSSDAVTEIYNATANNTGKVLDLNTDTGNYTSSANLQYWNRLGD